MEVYHSKNTVQKIGVVIFIVLCVSVGALLTILSFLSFEFAQAKISSLSPDGQITRFTEPLFQKLVMGLRGLGFFMWVLSGVMLVFFKQIAQAFHKIFERLQESCVRLIQDGKKGILETSKSEWSVLAIITLIGLGVRISFLFQPIRYDEAFTFLAFASKPLHLGLSLYHHPNNHLFNTFFMHLCYQLLGNQPWILRLPALVGGTLLVPATYLMTRMLYNKTAGLWSAGLVAASSVLIEYSTNARGYSFVALFFILTVLLAKVVKDSRSLTGWLLFMACSIMGFYSIPIMVYPLGLVIGWLFVSGLFGDVGYARKIFFRDLLYSIGIIGVGTLILYVPVILMNGLQSLTGNPYVDGASWPYFFSTFPKSLVLVWKQWNRDIPSVLSVFLAVCFFVGCFAHRKVSRDRVPIVVIGLIWCLLLTVATRVIPYERVWLFLLPLYFGVASAGIALILKGIRIRRFSNALPVLCLFFSAMLAVIPIMTQSVYYSEKTGTLRDAEEITLYLKQHLSPHDRVLAAVPANVPLAYYFKLHDVPSLHLNRDEQTPERFFVVLKEGQLMEGLMRLVPENQYGEPTVVRVFKTAKLFEVKKH